MSLINKMLQDLDQRHAADGSGTTLTQQLRPVPARKDWRRIMWEVGAGLIIGGGWAAWVLYQISPRSVVTDLAFQSQAKRQQAAGGLQPAAVPPSAQSPVTPIVQVPAQAAAQVPPAAAMPAAAEPAISAAAPAVPAPGNAEPAKLDTLKLATAIAAPFDEKGLGAKPRVERKSTQLAAPAANTARQGKPARETVAGVERAPGSSPSMSGSGLPPPKVRGSASIDKQPHVSTPGERAENEFRKATVLLNQGRVAEAMDGYKVTLQQDGGHAAARQALVGLLLENRRIDEAQQLLQEGLSLNPDRSAYTMLLARIQVERGDLQGAHDLMSRHAGSAANNADYHAFDAALLQRLGRHKEAVSEYQAALTLAPGAGLWWMGMGISLQADNRGAEALDAFKRAKSAGGLSPDLLAFVDQRMKQLQ
jgi:MSHA biogenesis protein MshN